MSEEVITLEEGKDYEILANDRANTSLVDSSLVNSANHKKVDNRKNVKRKKPLTIFSSLTYMLNQISENKDDIFRYLESFINNRPQTKENIGLAYAYELFSRLNPHERAHTSYEDLLELVTIHSSGRHTIDPSFFFSAVAGGAHICNVQTAHAIASVRASEVVNAMVREATKEEGSSFQDRKLLAEIVGVVDKEQRGVVVNNNLNTQVGVVVENKENGIPRFMGEIVAKDSMLREVYRKALKSGKEQD